MYLQIHVHAERELDEAYRYYENILPGLGERLLDEVQRGLARIKLFPQAWSPITENIRKCILNNFPYEIIYTIHGDTITILAFAHQHRKPEYWSNRYKNEH